MSGRRFRDWLYRHITSERCEKTIVAFQRCFGVYPKDGPPPGGYECRYRLVGYYFTVAAFMGSELFYLIFLPFVLWQVDFTLGRRAVLFWVTSLYIGNYLKDLLCLPRPRHPPVICLEDDHVAEYGFPSAHAIGTFLPLFVIIKGHEDHEVSMSAWWLVPWAAFALSVYGSRLYLGVHSLPDLIGGSLVGGLCLALFLWAGDAMEALAMTHPLGGWALPLLSLSLLAIHPTPAKVLHPPSPAHHHLFHPYRFLHMPWTSLLHLLLGLLLVGATKEALFKPVINNLLQPLLLPPPSSTSSSSSTRDPFLFLALRFLQYFLVGVVVIYWVPLAWNMLGL